MMHKWAMETDIGLTADRRKEVRSFFSRENSVIEPCTLHPEPRGCVPTAGQGDDGGGGDGGGWVEGLGVEEIASPCQLGVRWSCHRDNHSFGENGEGAATVHNLHTVITYLGGTEDLAVHYATL